VGSRRIASSLVVSLVALALVPTPGRAGAPDPAGPEEAGFRTDPLAAGLPRATTTRLVPRLSIFGPGPASGGGGGALGSAAAIAAGPDFDALTSSTTSPADPTGAIGRSAIVAAVNTKVAVYRRDGTLIDGPTSLNRITSALRGLNQTDPKVVYDPYEDVFLLVFLTYDDRNGFIDVVTIPGATAANRSTWCVLHMNGDQVRGDGKQFADYPSVGFTRDRVTVSTNNFDFRRLSRFRYVQLVSFTKRSLYDDPDCNDTIRPTVLAGDATRDPDGSRAFTIQPATSIGPTGSSQWLTSIDLERRRSSLVLWRLAPSGGRLRLTGRAHRIGSIRVPPLGRQCGGTPGEDNHAWDTGDTRLINAWFDGNANRVYAAHAVRRNAGGGAVESAVRWYELRPANRLGRSRLTRTGQIAVANADLAWPSIATDRAGTVFLNYSRAAAGECLGIWGAAVDRGTTSADAALLFPGEARYEFTGPGGADGGLERWGDYSAIARDPRRGSRMLFFNVYASGGGATTDMFTQRVTFVTSG
jgi:hypothetical protein